MPLTKAIFVIMLGAFLCAGTTARGASVPSVDDPRQTPAPTKPDPGAGARIAEKMVGLFRRHISAVDGDRCPMYPTCSQYSLEAFEKHGAIMGWVMTCDRLLRCGRDEVLLAPVVVTGGEQRCFDPVENNDFWWTR